MPRGEGECPGGLHKVDDVIRYAETHGAEFVGGRGDIEARIPNGRSSHSVRRPGILPTYSPGEIQRLAAQFDMLVTRLRDDEYLLYDNETKQLLLGSQSGRHKTGVSLEQIGLYLQRFQR